MRKVGRAVVSISLWLATASVLLFCVILGRLILAPVDIGFARDQIIAQTSSILPGWTVRFSTAQVGWDWGGVRPWIVLENVYLIDRRNRLTAQVPRAEVGVGFGGVLSGIGISTIELDRARVRVTDLGGFSDSTDDSLFDDLFGESGIPKPEIFIPVTEAFNRFTLRLLENAPAFDLIGFDGLSVELYRGEALSPANFLVTNFDIKRDDGALSINAQVDASIGGNPISTRLVGVANPYEGDVSIIASLSDFYPSTFPREAGLPEFLQYIRLPVGLSFKLDLDAVNGLLAAGIEADIGEGALYGGNIFPEPAPITYGRIFANYNAVEKVLAFNDIELELGDNKIAGDGFMYWHQTGSEPGLQFELKTDDVQIDEVLKYWPKKFHPDGRERGARAWISQHMMKADTNNIVFRVETAPSGAGSFFADSAFRMTFDYANLDTKFMQTMPPILGASGSAVLTRTQMDIGIDEGTLLGMPLAGSTAKLTDIHIRDGAWGTFNVFARGDVKTVMQVIDNPPLSVASKANLDIERLGGTAAIKAVVRAPLIKNPPPGSTVYDVTAQISEARVADFLGGEGLTEGELSLRVTPDKLNAAGTGRVNGVPLNLRWDEDFAAGREDIAAATTLVVLNGNMDADDMLALGVDVTNFLEGKAQSEASFEGRNFKFSRGTFTADASTALLKVPQLAYSKPRGVPAVINGGVIFTDTGSTVAPLLVKGDGIDLVASLNFGPKDSGTFDAEVQVRELGRHQLIAQLRQTDGGPIAATVTADSFDLAAFLAPDFSGRTIEREDPGDTAGAADFDLALSADTLLLENGEQWDEATLDLSFRGDEPVSVALSAVAGPDALPINVSLMDEPDAETGRRPLTGTALDGGQVLRGLGFFSHIKGGMLTLEGDTEGWGNLWHVEGRMRVNDSTLVAKSTLGDAVTEGTVSGLDSYLADGPLELDILDVPFVYDRRILGFNGLKANGPTMGLTLEGEVSTTDRLINVNGVVVPAYGLNSLLGNIPLVGGLFTGGEGKGLFGVAYRVKGSTDEPEVSVNALSGLAPGFLRLLFEGRKGRVADVETPPEAKADTDDPGDPNGGPNF